MNLITVSRGIRINPDNLTIDIHTTNAKRVRHLMLNTLKGEPPTDKDDVALMTRFCDALAGPLPPTSQTNRYR